MKYTHVDAVGCCEKCYIPICEEWQYCANCGAKILPKDVWFDTTATHIRLLEGGKVFGMAPLINYDLTSYYDIDDAFTLPNIDDILRDIAKNAINRLFTIEGGDK